MSGNTAVRSLGLLRRRHGVTHSSPAATTTRARGWARSYARRLMLTDSIIVLATMFGAQGMRDEIVGGAWWSSLDHTIITLVVSIGWLVALHVYGTREVRAIGVGVAEFRAIGSATLWVFGLFAIWCLLVRTDLGRGYLLVALPVGMTLLIAARFAWRAWLRRQRSAGRCSHSVVLLGSAETAVPVAADLTRNSAAGYRVLGLVQAGPTSGASPDPIESVRDQRSLQPPREVAVLGGVDDITEILERVGADTVVVTGSPELPPSKLRALGWQLEDERYNLVFTPSLTSVGGPRVHMTPVAGLSLLHVDTPRFEGVQRFAKRAFDLVGALGVLAVLGLPMLVVAALIKVSSPGPVLFSHERIGHRGKPFRMLKFRSMRQGADAELAELLRQQATDGTPLFKVVDDPRITPIGRVIRKYSIDELPQLFNVIRGEMSLVGPRPQVAGEVALYDEAAHRRHLVQPGMTGLWQVSGRSSLSWDDAIALDLHYVANWSIVTDLGILFRTFRAVIAPGETAH